MKKRIIAVTMVLFIFFSAFADIPDLPKSGKNLDSFVPMGWKLLQSASGDLNKDNIDDMVAIIENENDSEPEYNDRILFVVFKTGTGYALSVQSDTAVMLAGDGGAFGDPLSGLEVKRGSFLISFYGGAGSRWGISARFRYQDNGWYLIGYTEYSYEMNGHEESFDYNLLTGLKVVTISEENGKVKEEKINRGKKKLLSLLDYKATETTEKDF